MSRTVLPAFVLAAAMMGTAHADTIVNDFEAMTLGSLPGGADPRLPGNGAWYVPDNAATYGEIRDGIGRGGSRAMAVGNRGNGNDGVIDNIKSARLNEQAGESASPVNATNNIFRSSYYFRTANTSAADGFAFTTESWGPDRTSWAGLFYQTAFGDTSLTMYVSGIADQGSGTDFSFVALADNLAWGEWYRMETEIIFVDGAENDIVNYRLFTEAGSLVGQVLGENSWEEGARQFGYNGGNVFGVDSVGFQARGSYITNGAHDVAYVDDLRYESVPTPGALALLGLAGAAASRRRR
jgi:MYXO-CTERM domain-containing protein